MTAAKDTLFRGLVGHFCVEIYTRRSRQHDKTRQRRQKSFVSRS
jgi:hypothetical protein